MSKTRSKLPNSAYHLLSSRQKNEYAEYLYQNFISGSPISFSIENREVHEQLGLSGHVGGLYRLIEKNFRLHKDFKLIEEQYHFFKKTYSVSLRWRVYDSFVWLLISLEKPEEAITEWEELQEEEWEGWNRNFSYRDSALDILRQFEIAAKRPVISGKHIKHIAPQSSQMTKFGHRNEIQVLEYVQKRVYSLVDTSFFELFFETNSIVNNQNLKTFDVNHYIKQLKFFGNEAGGKYLKISAEVIERLLSPHSSCILKSGRVSKGFVQNVVIGWVCSMLIRIGENDFRTSIGAKKVGEGWISETELFYLVKEALPRHIVIHHGRPKWLGSQHFDIWIPSLNVAIEYQGKQHDEPVGYFGGEDAFLKGQIRDKKKKNIAISNSCNLIEVRPGYDFSVIKKELLKLSDMPRL